MWTQADVQLRKKNDFYSTEHYSHSYSPEGYGTMKNFSPLSQKQISISSRLAYYKSLFNKSSSTIYRCAKI